MCCRCIRTGSSQIKKTGKEAYSFAPRLGFTSGSGREIPAALAGVPTSQRQDVRKHPKAAISLKQLGLIKKPQFEKNCENTLPVKEAFQKVYDYINSLKWGCEKMCIFEKKLWGGRKLRFLKLKAALNALKMLKKNTTKTSSQTAVKPLQKVRSQLKFKLLNYEQCKCNAPGCEEIY